MKEGKLVRINIILPPEERDAFDRWCRYGNGDRVSMSWRIRQLMQFDAAGKLNVPKTKPPRAHRINAPKVVEPPKPRAKPGKHR